MGTSYFIEFEEPAVDLSKVNDTGILKSQHHIKESIEQLLNFFT